jgi:hypothetical protein
MYTFREFRTSVRIALAATAVVFATALASPATSHAALGTAAGTKITNIATVNYNNSANVAQAPQSASTDVTVTLVPSAVNISPGITTNTVSEGTATVVTYTVVGTANGKDTYGITSAETAGSGTISDVNGTQTIGAFTPAPATLAGTSLAADAVALATSITVPYDSSVGMTATGLVAGGAGFGTVLKIGANTYRVTAIGPNVGNTMALTLDTAITGATVITGTIISEQKTFTVSYPSGVLTGASTNTQTATATVTSTSAGNPAATSANTVITVNVLPATLTITKTACTTGPVAGLAACFGATGNAAPGGTVLYKVLIVNGGTGVAKAVVINDTIQKYLTYNGGSAKYGVGATGSQVTRSYDGSVGGALTALTDANAADDGYLYTAGPPSTINYAYPVDLANGNELVLFYSATVN